MRTWTGMPREFDSLPYAHRLQPFTDTTLDRDGDYDSVHFNGCAFEDVDGGSTTIGESVFSSVTFTRGRYRRTQFDDVWMHTVRWIGSDLAESGWMDAEFISGLLAGVELFGSQMRRVTFHHCKFDSVNFRTARLRDVSFNGCLLRDVDFSGAALTGVTFPGSTLDQVRIDNAKLTDVDLREAGSLGFASGLEALRGATISTTQLLDLAPSLAQVLGLTVKDTP